MFFRQVDIDSHSFSVTLDDAPTESAVSVVGTGVELGARPDAILMLRCYGVFGW
jgi:hypothetical protein